MSHLCIRNPFLLPSQPYEPLISAYLQGVAEGVPGTNDKGDEKGGVEPELP